MDEEDFITFMVDNMEEINTDKSQLHRTFKFLRQVKEPYRTKVINAIASRDKDLPAKPIQQSDFDSLKSYFPEEAEGIEQYFEL